MLISGEQHWEQTRPHHNDCTQTSRNLHTAQEWTLRKKLFLVTIFSAVGADRRRRRRRRSRPQNTMVRPLPPSICFVLLSQDSLLYCHHIGALCMLGRRRRRLFSLCLSAPCSHPAERPPGSHFLYLPCYLSPQSAFLSVARLSAFFGGAVYGGFKMSSIAKQQAAADLVRSSLCVLASSSHSLFVLRHDAYPL